MSTKIYNVYKFDGRHSDVISYLQTFKENVKIEFESRIDNWVRKDYPIRFRGIDAIEHAKKPSECEYGMEIRQLLELKRNSLGEHGDMLHYDPSVVVYFFNNDIFIQFFDFEIDESDHSQLSDYHYQDSTDLSNYDWRNEDWDDMSDERKEELETDWAIRSSVWDQIFTDDLRSPKTAGLTYSLLPVNWEMDEIITKVLDKYKKEE